MSARTVRFAADSEEYEAYLAVPESGRDLGVVVIQEWWGLVNHIRRVTDRFAAEGFVALAPDLYRGVRTSDPDEGEAMMQALHIGEVEIVLRKAIVSLLAQPETVGSRIGVVGFCMGGQLALYAATTNPIVGACVDFYGIHPEVRPVLRDLNGPVLGIFAENDPYATAEAVAALDTELTLLQKPHEFVTYPGTSHAFFNDDRPEVYHHEAAQSAWQRTIAFLHDNLTTNP